MFFNGYSNETVEFLKELELNNNKKWFEKNRSKYEKYVLDVNKAFVVEMGEYLQALVPAIKFIPKAGGSLFRLNYDNRFHKNRPVYKNYFGAFFWEGSGKKTLSPGFYFHFKIDKINAGTKIHTFDKRILSGYREYIKNDMNAKSLQQILKNLQSKGFKTGNKKYKRIPAGMDKNAQYFDLYLFDSLYAELEMPYPKWLYNKTLIEELLKIYKTLLPLYRWMNGMIDSIPSEHD